MPNPNKFSSKSEFMSACVSQRQDEHPSEDNDQSVAVCISMWDKRGDKSGNSELVFKTHADTVQVDRAGGLEFVLSDATPDRYNDVILADGWELKNFSKNPIALFNHNPDFPIGRWENLRVYKGELRGHLRMAPEGTSPRIDELRRLIEAGILRAVSVGFRPLQAPRARSDSNQGSVYGRSELVETSLVSVPANPNAISVARSMKISDATMKMVFGKNADMGLVNRGVTNGANAGSSSPTLKGTKMTTPITVRVEETQARIVAFQDQLQKHLETVDDANPTEESTVITETITKQIEAQEKQLVVLKKAEAQLANAAAAATGGGIHGEVLTPMGGGGGSNTGALTIRGSMFNAAPAASGGGSEQPMTLRDSRIYAEVGIKPKGADFLWRALAVQFRHFCDKGAIRNPIDILKANYGECDRTYHMFNVVNRAASAPAMTGTSGWADTLVQTVIGDMIQSLLPYSIYPRLAALGQRYTFGRNGVISIPARTVSTSLGGAFVLQGNPIPVKQGAFAAVTLSPKKMGVITTLTREMAEHSQPALEGILRDAILQDTAVAIDTVLTDATAASATRPAGLKNGVTKVTASSATPALAGFTADVAGLAGALTTASVGNLRSPVWIINPTDLLKISLLQSSTGDFVFRDEIAGGTLMGIPVIKSTTGTNDVMFLLDAADFATATGDAPRFDVSDQAVLHMEDTTPLAIGTAGTPNTVAAPVRSLYQTDTMAIRMIMDINWTWLRTGTIQWTDTMTWN